MKTLLRLAALVLLLGGLGFWAVKGSNTGWTKNRVPKKTLDEVTGIEAVSYEERFVPGVEFLGGIAAGAGALAGVSFLFKSKSGTSVTA